MKGSSTEMIQGYKGQKWKATDGTERQQFKGRRRYLRAGDGVCRNQQGWHYTCLKGLTQIVWFYIRKASKQKNTPSRWWVGWRRLIEQQAMLMCSLRCLSPRESATHNINNDDFKTNTEPWTLNNSNVIVMLDHTVWTELPWLAQMIGCVGWQNLVTSLFFFFTCKTQLNHASVQRSQPIQMLKQWKWSSI